MFLYDHVIPLITTGIRRLKARTGTREIFRKRSEIQRKYSKPSDFGSLHFLWISLWFQKNSRVSVLTIPLAENIMYGLYHNGHTLYYKNIHPLWIDILHNAHGHDGVGSCRHFMRILVASPSAVSWLVFKGVPVIVGIWWHPHHPIEGGGGMSFNKRKWLPGASNLKDPS